MEYRRRIFIYLKPLLFYQFVLQALESLQQGRLESKGGLQSAAQASQAHQAIKLLACEKSKQIFGESLAKNKTLLREDFLKPIEGADLKGISLLAKVVLPHRVDRGEIRLVYEKATYYFSKNSSVWLLTVISLSMGP